MKSKPLIAIIYNFFNSLSLATIATIVISYPLLALFTLGQKNYLIVYQSIPSIMYAYGQLLIYLLWPFSTKLQMRNFPTSVSAAEHFYECKLLFSLALIVFIIGLIIYLYLKRRKKVGYIALTKNEAIFFMILPIILLPLALTNFDEFFISFHQMIFHNNNWLFDPNTDPIINVLTENFFAACFAVAGIVYEMYYSRYLFSK
ncbi:TIGR01906 family membrane protein [Lactobacillus sp. PV034]|uniref:TIGR01906 family membrane protein n=1 Tax=Lactobacillus sp. PV034 TaxID=2594495 RepID=UPI0022407261|nr:TIGR01906 family membrane protein [Lactobacillus sp. PV034]QNQ81485.1 TIGR01906 family membrane protein [Lactobacillus sp. PV034]